MISILGSRESKRKFKCITAAHSGHGRNHQGIAVLRHGLRHWCRGEYDLHDKILIIKKMRQFEIWFHDEERHHQQSKSLWCSSYFLTWSKGGYYYSQWQLDNDHNGQYQRLSQFLPWWSWWCVAVANEGEGGHSGSGRWVWQTATSLINSPPPVKTNLCLFRLKTIHIWLYNANHVFRRLGIRR